ncbi:putative RNA polymerase II subunit B1 CTD phosphatase RPAP2 isoform X2 [Centruroides vittatus]|uniref:putative RNA polymerase II subunit B1 CTD phosphatase RPAP2 isoform X2 n=1 Tax=Centruroides vittatus TaxID=120091 RepID=UPI00350F826A
MYLRTTIKGEEVEVAKQKQEECKRKALEIVEQMIDNPISEDWFLKACKDIHRNDYEDIIVERFISKLCGYPLCLNSVSNVPRQKYAISTKTNKVYDITERKVSISVLLSVSRNLIMLKNNYPQHHYGY